MDKIGIKKAPERANFFNRHSEIYIEVLHTFGQPP